MWDANVLLLVLLKPDLSSQFSAPICCWKRSRFNIWLCIKLAKVRALALVCRPAGKIAHASTGGNDQSVSTAWTVLAFNSGANIHSDAMARPRSASTHDRAPTVVSR